MTKMDEAEYFKKFQRRKTHVECGWTPAQIEIALAFALKMEMSGASENCYCLTVEGLIDGYMRSRFNESTAGIFRPVQEKYWSKQAIAAYKRNKAVKLIVEHGTPRRHIMRMAFDLYKSGKFDEKSLDAIGRKYWKVAVLTTEECVKLDSFARSTLYPSPDERWAAAGIEVVAIKGFDKDKNIIV